MRLLTIADCAPPPRVDGLPFTKARIEEAQTAAGPFTAIETQNLSPLDGEPASPKLRELTTSKATLAEGWYRITWLDANSVESAPSEPRFDGADGTRPSVTEVASLLRARTRIRGGQEEGTFNARTRPTGDEVERLIEQAQDDVLGKVQAPTPGCDYERRVRNAVSLYTAILIETSYFPEQVKEGKSPAATFQQLYSSRIKALIAEGETGSPQGLGEGDSPADAAWAFPENRGGMIGLGTRWMYER